MNQTLVFQSFKEASSHAKELARQGNFQVAIRQIRPGTFEVSWQRPQPATPSPTVTANHSPIEKGAATKSSQSARIAATAPDLTAHKEKILTALRAGTLPADKLDRILSDPSGYNLNAVELLELKQAKNQLKLRQKNEKKWEICSRCGGDGGNNSDCYACGGSGWKT